MRDSVKAVGYYAITVDDRPGEGARITSELKKRNLNLLAVHGFPIAGGKAQIDLVPEDPAAFSRTARELGWTLGEKRTALLIQGEDRVGALTDVHQQLAQANINLVAETAVSAGNGRYACILWVPAKDVEKATSILGAEALVR